ncbi:DUF2306 domain-containing protein [Actinophytocola oryzae]|uniref:Putative membrane protein DUF2306 n=1 Tax=Actinophytocola oryzae TaxID=502181 RepID=A0A4R7UY09_9PSEU|nr:DUF2306 domain-containing protein [Actinophytocola oryzae]TDV41044.1 putative membrane protein DUF2306 [Actinophytocola oryzae]
MTLIENVDERTAPEPPPPSRPSKPFWRRPWILPLAAVVAVYLYMQIEPVAGVPEEQLFLPPHDDYPLYYPLLVIHMSAATLAMITMVLQVWPRMRLQFPKVHRVSGRIYVIGAVIGGLSGLGIVFWAPMPGKVGSLCMLLFWLGTTVAAYRYARRGQWAKHRRHMLYSFAVAANNPWAFFFYVATSEMGIMIDPIYFGEGGRWIPWVGNLMLVQWWLYRTARRPAPVPASVARAGEA